MADPALIAASGLLLLSLGCLAQDCSHTQVLIDEEGAGTLVNYSIDVITLLMAGTMVVAYYTAETEVEYARPSPILYALAFVEAMSLLTGFGDPHQEDDLKKGAQELTELCEQLHGTSPNSTWQSGAAQTYASRVTTSQDAAADLAQCDQDLADLTQRGAELVIHLRLAFGLLKAVLLVALAYEACFCAEGDYWTGRLFADQAALAGIGAALAIMAVFGCFAIMLCDSANHLAHRYRNVGKSGVRADIDTHTPTPPPAAAQQRELRTADTDKDEMRVPGPGIRAGGHLGATPERPFATALAPSTISAATVIGPTRIPAMAAQVAPPRRPTASPSLAERPAPRTATSAQPSQDTGERAPVEAAALEPRTGRETTAGPGHQLNPLPNTPRKTSPCQI